MTDLEKLAQHIHGMKYREDEQRRAINEAQVRLETIMTERMKLETLVDNLKPPTPPITVMQ